MAITPKSEDKYVEKCSTAQSFIRTEMSTYRIGTLNSTANLANFLGMVSLKVNVYFKIDIKHNLTEK